MSQHIEEEGEEMKPHAEGPQRVDDPNSTNNTGEKDGRDLGGLLDAKGQDIRTKHGTDERRTGEWRGEERADDAGVQYDFAIKILDYKIQSSVLTQDLRVYILFLIMFCFFFLIGRDVTSTFYMIRQVHDEIVGNEFANLKITKTYDDIANAQDWIDFVQTSLVIQLHDTTMGNNILLGALRFRTLRVTKSSCTVNKYIIPDSMPVQAKECYGPWSDDNEDTGVERSRFNQVKRWTYKSCAQTKGSALTSGQFSSLYHCGGFQYEVPFYVTSNGGYTRMDQSKTSSDYVDPTLQDPTFVDTIATRFVMVEWFMYNPQIDKFLGVKLFTEASPGGMWRPSFQLRGFEVWTQKDLGKTIYDFFFFAFVLYYIYDFIGDMFRYRKVNGKFLGFFFNVWNFLELVNLAIFLTVFSFRWVWWDKCMKTELHLDTLAFKPEYPGELDSILTFYSQQVYFNSVNTILTFLKLLKFLRLNDRLNILTRTLSESQDSIIGVLFIFFLVVTAFAMTGHGLFGLGVWDFRSIDASYSTLMRMLLGDFDYESLKVENRVLAGMFFWAFIILGLFCLLNFLIGVLMEAFGKVSKTRTILPLDEVLIKSWADLRKVLTVTYIKNAIQRRIKGHTTENVLTNALTSIKDYRERVYPPDAVDVVETHHQMLYKRHVYECLSDETRELIGDSMIEFIWDDIVYEWDRSRQADEVIEAQKNVESTMQGVKDQIGPHLEKLESFVKRLTDLESSLHELAKVL
eukprot:PhF_6_TR643/c0_g1_i1/m.896/K04990/PKD2L1; polycystin 2L1